MNVYAYDLHLNISKLFVSGLSKDVLMPKIYKPKTSAFGMPMVQGNFWIIWDSLIERKEI